jgi:hypothetical protein
MFMNANVMLARCAVHKKLFGIRIEERGDDWVRTWAFPIDETRAKHEGFDKTEIEGSLDPTPEYPGCPYCKNVFLLQCTCGKMICCERKSSDENAEGEYSVTCEWCGAVAKDIEYADKISVDSGDF